MNRSVTPARICQLKKEAAKCSNLRHRSASLTAMAALCALALPYVTALATEATPPATSTPTATVLNAEPVTFFTEDPSTVPVYGGDKVSERFRILVDLNRDGRMDMLLSAPIAEFGNAGGYFTVFIAEDNGYREIGSISGHPLALALENVDYDYHKGGAKVTRIWSYHRLNGSSGSIGYYEIYNNTVSDSKHIEISRSGLEDQISDKLYETIFTDPYLLQSEKSTTKGNTVIWKPWSN